MLLNFTGSDRCGGCIKLHGGVFDKKAFKDYAAKDLVVARVAQSEGGPPILDRGAISD